MNGATPEINRPKLQTGKHGLRGKEGFFSYYEQVYGDAWPEIMEALEKPSTPILRFAPKYRESLQQSFSRHQLSFTPLESYEYAVRWPMELPLGEKLPAEILSNVYVQNASSLKPVQLLDIQPADTVWDACAAPGGKASFITELLDSAQGGSLLATDTSSNRVRRLQDVLREYTEVQTEHVQVRKMKAEILFKQYPEHFSKILVDAPCSSEKHVLHNEKALQDWSAARIKQLVFRQRAILSGAWLALQPGGRLVYSTCALTPEENEGIIEWFTKKKNYSPTVTHMERTRPESIDGIDYDPMFMAVLEKTVQ